MKTFIFLKIEINLKTDNKDLSIISIVGSETCESYIYVDTSKIICLRPHIEDDGSSNEDYCYVHIEDFGEIFCLEPLKKVLDLIENGNIYNRK